MSITDLWCAEARNDTDDDGTMTSLCIWFGRARIDTESEHDDGTTEGGRGVCKRSREGEGLHSLK